ncbi:hypothetical protein K502DRAFT_336124 [Neoconidiobolus thromboides FSU 785]|nr:hypothetical protein K502DRAFT_336124 [Neoconidiobolus thromboides FSU 785]
MVEFTIKYPKDFGWVGIGFGLWMASADMYVVWKNKDNSFTLSDRYGVGNYEPMADKQQDLVLNTNKTSYNYEQTNNNNVVVFRRLKDTKDKDDELYTNKTTSFLWAYCKTLPNTSKVDATIDLHDNFGKFELDIFSGKAIGGSGGGIKTTSNLVHGVLLFLGWNIFPYLGILCAGPLRNRFGKLWFKLHVSLLGVIAPLFIISGIILAIVMANTAHFSNAHEILGLLIFVLMFIQLILGVAIDRLYNPDRLAVPWYDKLHWYFGRILFLLAQINIILGLITWDPNFNGLLPIWVTFIVILLIEIGFYIVYTFLNPKSEDNYMLKENAFK